MFLTLHQIRCQCHTYNIPDSLQLEHHCKSIKACFSVTNVSIRKSPNYLKRQEQYCILQGFQSIAHTPSSHNKGGKISVTRIMNMYTYINGMIKVVRLHKLQSLHFVHQFLRKHKGYFSPTQRLQISASHGSLAQWDQDKAAGERAAASF